MSGTSRCGARRARISRAGSTTGASFSRASTRSSRPTSCCSRWVYFLGVGVWCVVQSFSHMAFWGEGVGLRGLDSYGSVLHLNQGSTPLILFTFHSIHPNTYLPAQPNGRFEVGKKICLSISAHHPEHWQPAWGGKSRPSLFGGCDDDRRWTKTRPAARPHPSIDT